MTDLSAIFAIYRGSNGEATRALYAELEQKLGPIGKVAVNLFRACKCSERAKLYRRGRGYKTAAYERKDWSIRNLATALHVEHAGQLLHIRNGWGIDAALQAREDPHYHVLYVDLPTGQVSFHNAARYDGPDHPGEWDGAAGQSADRICRFVAQLLAGAVVS
jgi:hypothetical protein